MSDQALTESLVERDASTRIVLVVMDGLGGLPDPETGRTELETAETPNLDALAGRSSLGLLDPVGPGITPGSGPGHLSLFGYDPRRYQIGRGALSALGVGIEMEPGDVAARLNLATFDGRGRVSDRRAGRPSDEEARRVVDKLMAGLAQPEGATITLVPEKEHRVVLWIRGEGLQAGLTETDPLRTGVEDVPLEALTPGSERAAGVVRDFLAQARRILADEPACTGFLARGFASYEAIPSMEERFGLRGTAIAKYPMYRGVARIVGMRVDRVPEGVSETLDALEGLWGGYDFYFLHFKDTDTCGHDGDFQGKVRAIQAVDEQLPRILALEPDVVIVTGDHSTPTLYREHSWHAVPVLLHSRWPRPSAGSFGEGTCRTGDLGRFPGTDLVPLALAHAGRLVKFGA
ncbi:MAG TPA: 2,3-bisphosphoglycerate-independent phosphoglycerate mutase [Longimicrobiales bacterium]|jgi:2,3-bisphosphoglycerate-independent phosphoglycerate mutase